MMRAITCGVVLLCLIVVGIGDATAAEESVCLQCHAGLMVICLSLLSYGAVASMLKMVSAVTIVTVVIHPISQWTR